MANYHSQFVPAPNTVGNMALLPLRTKVRGPAPTMPDMDKDIIDEALYLFKSLIFFRQYEIKSESDRVLVYLVLYILECLKKIQKVSPYQGVLQSNISFHISNLIFKARRLTMFM
ncbi:hypothetical protein EG68_02363 [Paragonimus skrjabini miyazakii]|uniref:Actin-related protein 2/3 complex subunit 3 n=1 Tax=Paragonimus skrjabini miyazakii TaxID=59628 RepID=A0A8S9Z4C7_9TREM|nr:hypothetical protein EG68_02363 [Paragonimus skrjabini miyazakii]